MATKWLVNPCDGRRITKMNTDPFNSNTRLTSRPCRLPTDRRIGTAILLAAFSAAVTFAYAGEAVPQPIFPDSRPVCSWESLRNVTLPDTAIDSVVTNADGSCRVTATVTHPPSSDRV